MAVMFVFISTAKSNVEIEPRSQGVLPSHRAGRLPDIKNSRSPGNEVGGN